MTEKLLTGTLSLNTTNQPKIYNQELLFLRSARLIELNIHMKGHADTLNGFKSESAHEFVTDRWMDDHGKSNMTPNPEGGVDVKS